MSTQLLYIQYAHDTNHRHTGNYIMVIPVQDTGNTHTEIVGVDIITSHTSKAYSSARTNIDTRFIRNQWAVIQAIDISTAIEPSTVYRSRIEISEIAPKYLST